MNVSNPRSTPPLHPGEGFRLFGLRPLPLFLALGMAAASAWVLGTTGNDGRTSGGADAVASGGSRWASPGRGNAPSAATGGSQVTGVPDTRVLAPGSATPRQAFARQTNPSAGQSSAVGLPADRKAAPTDGAGRAVGDSPTDQSTLYLTIVGDQKYAEWGAAGQRTARVGDLPATARAAGQPSPWEEPVAEDPVDGPGYTGSETASSEPVENPLGPEPQQCPRTLPPGSTQEMANALQGQFGCRYLSSCRIGDGACTWHYQGRG